MSRPLWMALLVVGALSLYLMGSEGDDALLAPTKERAGARAPAVARPPGSAGRSAQAGPVGLDEQALSRRLIDGVLRWQARPGPAALQADAEDAAALIAWASVLPPPAPAPSPAQAEPAQAEASPPMAPPFSLPWVGRFNDAGQTSDVERAVLQGPRATLVVKAGDVIDGQWRIDGIRDRRMTVTYLPLNQPQTVAMK